MAAEKKTAKRQRRQNYPIVKALNDQNDIYGEKFKNELLKHDFTRCCVCLECLSSSKRFCIHCNKWWGFCKKHIKEKESIVSGGLCCFCEKKKDNYLEELKVCRRKKISLKKQK